MKIHPKVALPIIVIVVGFVAGGGMIASRPEVATSPPERPLPLVRVHEAAPQDIQLTIEARGTVVPRTESELVSEVSGRIVWVSPSLASGGFLEPGEKVIELDARDYEIALVRAESALARAQSELELARNSLSRNEQLRSSGVASSAAHEAAVNGAKVAAAIERDARAVRDQAQRDLDRTRVLAPFAGRVRETHVNVGQFVARGTPVARIYAVDYAEVRLPIPDAEAAFVDLPIAYRDGGNEAPGPEVLLRSRFAGADHTWRGRIVRTEGELDPQTRMIYAVARVEDPYGRGEEPDRPPLSVGLFVDAEILGRHVDDAIVLPRAALRGESQVAVVDDAGELTLRPIEVRKRNRNTIVVSDGIRPGERVCTSPLAISVEGMKVRIVEDGGRPARPAAADEPHRSFAGYRSAP